MVGVSNEAGPLNGGDSSKTVELRSAALWEAHLDRHCIWIVSPEGYPHSHAFDELAESIADAFAELGGSAPIVRHPSQWAGRSPLVFGANLIPYVGNPMLPRDSIVINLEQVTSESAWMNSDYLSLLRRSAVFDYSIRNLEALRRVGVPHAQILEVGYARTLTKIADTANKDIDVLFYGSINERRARVLDDLVAQGVKVTCLFGAYGTERDEAIARAKIVLNMHFYESNIFEIVRVSYLLANKVCVVSEGSEEDVDVRRFVGGIAFACYHALRDKCLELLSTPARRRDLAQAGFERLTRSRQSALLRNALISLERPHL